VVKAVGCSMLKLLVEQYQLIINDHETIHELSRFSKKGTSYEAEPGAHDDLAMALVLFAWMTDQQYFKELTDINTLEKLRDRSEEEMEQELVSFYHAQAHVEEEFTEYDDGVIDLYSNPSRMAEFAGLFS
jgi:aromatic ring-opening dioxygenase catalytic subunit (LigB family)